MGSRKTHVQKATPRLERTSQKAAVKSRGEPPPDRGNGSISSCRGSRGVMMAGMGRSEMGLAQICCSRQGGAAGASRRPLPAGALRKEKVAGEVGLLWAAGVVAAGGGGRARGTTRSARGCAAHCLRRTLSMWRCGQFAVRWGAAGWLWFCVCVYVFFFCMCMCVFLF